jgi:hypothetical protein
MIRAVFGLMKSFPVNKTAIHVEELHKCLLLFGEPANENERAEAVCSLLQSFRIAA